MKNKITLAICVYNSELYIQETLSCIIKQTCQEFDLLIVNDCSTDSTNKVIEHFFTEHSRAHVCVNFDKNQGIANARKYVLESVDTKYIIFVDADDKPYPSLVEKLYTKIKTDKDLMAVGCYHEYIDSLGNKIRGGLFLGEKNKEDFIEKASKRKLIFMQPTAVIHREIALKAGGFITDGYFTHKPRYQDFCEDLDLWTRMSDFYTEGKAIIVIPEVLSQYRKMENTTSSNTLGMFLKMRFIKSNLLNRRQQKKENTFIDFYNNLTKQDIKRLKRDAKAANLLRTGAFSFAQKNFIKGLVSILHAFVINPSYLIQKVKANLIKKQ